MLPKKIIISEVQTMVDFNAEQTISTPPIDILRVMILQRYDDVLNSISAYYKYSDSGVEAPTHIVSARIRTLLYTLKPALDRWINPKTDNMDTFIMENILDNPESKIEDLFKVFNKLSWWLDEKKITRLDNQKVLKDMNPETENEEKGF